MVEAVVHTGKNFKTVYRGEVMNCDLGKVTLWCTLKNGREAVKTFRKDEAIIQIYKDGKLI